MLIFLGCMLPQQSFGQGCKLMNNSDTVEYYYHELKVASVESCCQSCSSDDKCKFATFAAGVCYLKDAATLTPKGKSGQFIVYRAISPHFTSCPKCMEMTRCFILGISTSQSF